MLKFSVLELGQTLFQRRIAKCFNLTNNSISIKLHTAADVIPAYAARRFRALLNSVFMHIIVPSFVLTISV